MTLSLWILYCLVVFTKWCRTANLILSCDCLWFTISCHLMESTHNSQWVTMPIKPHMVANNWVMYHFLIYYDGPKFITWRHNERDDVLNHQPHDYSSVYSGADQRKYQSSASLAFVGVFTAHRWSLRTKGQQCGKCFHLMTSSCDVAHQESILISSASGHTSASSWVVEHK